MSVCQRSKNTKIAVESDKIRLGREGPHSTTPSHNTSTLSDENRKWRLIIFFLSIPVQCLLLVSPGVHSVDCNNGGVDDGWLGGEDHTPLLCLTSLATLHLGPGLGLSGPASPDQTFLQNNEYTTRPSQAPHYLQSYQSIYSANVTSQSVEEPAEPGWK